MATPREQLADLLRQARLAAGFSSHQALARRLNVSRPVITRAENPREAVPSHAVIRDWAQATGADLAQLIGYENRARNRDHGLRSGRTTSSSAPRCSAGSSPC